MNPELRSEWQRPLALRRWRLAGVYAAAVGLVVIGMAAGAAIVLWGMIAGPRC